VKIDGLHGGEGGGFRAKPGIPQMDGDIGVFHGQARFFRREIPFRADEDRDIGAPVLRQRFFDADTLRNSRR